MIQLHTSLGVSELVKQAVWSKRICEQCKGMNERTSELPCERLSLVTTVLPSGFLVVLDQRFELSLYGFKMRLRVSISGRVRLSVRPSIGRSVCPFRVFIF